MELKIKDLLAKANLNDGEKKPYFYLKGKRYLLKKNMLKWKDNVLELILPK